MSVTDKNSPKSELLCGMSALAGRCAGQRGTGHDMKVQSMLPMGTAQRKGHGSVPGVCADSA